jgi:hypothetical protein
MRLDVGRTADVKTGDDAPAPPHSTVYSPRNKNSVALGAGGDERLVFTILSQRLSDDRVDANGGGGGGCGS